MRPTRNRKPLGRRIRATVLAIAATTVLAACNSSSGQTIQPLTTDSATTIPATVAPTTTSTALTGDAAIIAVDKAENDLFFEVASKSPVNPADPRIPLLAAGKELGIVRNSLTVLALKRQHNVGSYVLTGSRVAERNGTGTTVIVLSCVTDGIGVADDATGQVVTPAANTKSLINDRLELINGKWMVTDGGVRSPAC